MTWRDDLGTAIDQIQDPELHRLAAETLERGLDLALRAAAGDQQAAADLLPVGATAARIPNAVRHRLAKVAEDAAWRRLRELLWGTLLGLPVPK